MRNSRKQDILAKKDTINQFVEVVNQIINEKDNNIKINHIIRDSIIKQKKENPLICDKELSKAFLDLYQHMPDCNRNLWNYNNPIIKGSVKGKIDQISKLYLKKYAAEEIKELDDRLKIQDEKYQIAYGETGRKYSQGKINDLYVRLGNSILKEIKNYEKDLNKNKINIGIKNITDINHKNFSNTEVVDDTQMINDTENINDNQKQFENAMEKSDEGVIRDTKSGTNEIIQHGKIKCDWNDEYKRAKEMIYKSHCYEDAYHILKKESSAGNILADFDIAEMYQYGRGFAINKDVASSYYKKALEGFKILYKQEITPKNPKNKDYFAYRIGKQYYYGLGSDVDYENALQWLDKSSSQYAVYILGKMAYYGQGMEKDNEMAFKYYTKIMEKNPYAAYQAAVILDKKEIISEKFDKNQLYNLALDKFIKMEKEQKNDNVEYKLGIMYYEGLGTTVNEELAIEYLENSAETGNIFAKNKLASIYLKQGNVEKLPEILKYLEESANKLDNSWAMYSLGNIYLSDEYDIHDQEQALSWYIKSEKFGNEAAAYKLGKFYYNNGEYKEAIEHMNQCDNQYSNYILGKIYLDKDSSFYDINKGINSMEKAADENNSWAMYTLGKIFSDKDLNIYNIEKAIQWFKKSEELENEAAAYKLGKIYYEKNDFNRAIKYLNKCDNQYSNYILGNIYMNPESAYYNTDKGIDFLLKSANMGNSYAEMKIGILYLKGEGLDKNGSEAMKWLTSAANHGNEYASELIINIQNNGYKHSSVISLQNAITKMKKGLKSELEKQRNIREHDRLVEREN
jgi:TPR repeat protein